MTGAEMIAQFQNTYTPSLIYRNTNWIFHAGKPVYLLRDPEGATWVLQEFTKDVDPSLEADNLEVLGRQVQGTAGRLDVRDEDPRRGALARHGPRRRLGRDHPRRVPLHLPGLRLRRRQQRQLHPVTGFEATDPGCPGSVRRPATWRLAESRSEGSNDEYNDRGAAQGDTRRASDRERAADGPRALRHRQGGLRHVAGGSRGREDPRRPHARGVGVHRPCADGDPDTAGVPGVHLGRREEGVPVVDEPRLRRSSSRRGSPPRTRSW